MNFHLLQLKRLIDSNPVVTKLLNFNLEDSKLLAELDFVGDTFLVFYSHNSSKYMLYVYFTENSELSFTIIDSFEDVLGELNAKLVDRYDSVIANYSKKWWSFLPEWIVLNPLYLDEEQHGFLKNEISKILCDIDSNKDLTKQELGLLQKWSFEPKNTPIV